MDRTHILQDLWAKSAPEGQTGETLLQHTEFVVRALAGIAQLRPDLHLQAESPRLWHWTFWACCLHDLGKAATGFQKQLRTGMWWGHRHEVLSLAFLGWLPCEETDREWIAAAIASHHKDVNELQQSYPNDLEEDDVVLGNLIAQLPHETVQALLAVLNSLVEQWRITLGFASLGVEPCAFDSQALDVKMFHKYAAEQLCRNLKVFYRLERALRQGKRAEAEITASLLLRGLIVTADHTASAHVQPLTPTLRGVDDLLQRLHLDWDALYEHQRLCTRADVSTILTAPTGSGKTESALLWAAKQSEKTSGTPRLFYVLPFQASMNAMHRRLKILFPNEVGLQHGHSLHALYRAYLQADATPPQAARLAQWARNLSNLHAYPIKVLSPYQLLKACYRLRGYEAVLADCFGGLFIFDEMHAYEPERLAMIVGMMQFLHRRLRARFCIMTATMPPPIVARIREALGSTTEIKASDALAERFCRHRLRLQTGEIVEEKNLEYIVNMASSGHSVLACCNTVRRAQELYVLLQARLPDTSVNLLHSRFTAGDRLRKEGAWLKDLSKPIQPDGVLVATQVVEVSLNLDFDTIFTEPAPLEALLQRFGRVNRMARRPPAPVYVFQEPTDGQYVYDPLMVQQTLTVIASVDDNPINESQIAEWLAEIYTGEILEEWIKRYEQSAREFEAICIQTLHAFASDDSLEDHFYRAFDNIDVLPACFERKYGVWIEKDPIRATEMLVGISWRQYNRLKREGRIKAPIKRGYPPVVDAPYSSETGLLLDNPMD